MLNTSAMRVVCKKLFKEAEPLNIYALHLNFSIPISDLIEVIEFLISSDLVTYNDFVLQAKPNFKQWVFTNRNDIFFKDIREGWKDTSSFYLKSSKRQNRFQN